jgi:hypothetical protein
MKGRKREERRREYKRREEKNWGRKRKLMQEMTKQIDIWTEYKRKGGSNRLKKRKK